MGRLRPSTNPDNEEKSEDILQSDDEALSKSTQPMSAGGAPPQEKPRRARYENEARDVQNTGRWGTVGRREKYIIVGVVGLILVGAVVALVILVSGGDGGPVLPPTQAPTNRPVTSNEQQWTALQEIIKNNEVLNTTSELIDKPISYLDGKAADTSASPQVQAAAWLILDDKRDEYHESKFFQWRYALATLYFALGGPGWTDNEGWLGSDDVCTWFGVICNFPNLDKIVTLDLTRNNLVGSPLPEEINLMDELISLWLASNDIGGEFPSLAVGSLPNLLYLYINNNKFSGEVTADIRANGKLHTLYIQENDFQGNFPIDLCPKAGGSFKLREFGLDCDKLRCFCCSVNPTNSDAFDPCF